MLVKFQKPLKIGDTTYKAGDVVDLEEMQASILIKKGLAIKQEDKNHKKDNPTEKQNIFIKLYGADTTLMGKLRTEVFKEFLNSLKKKHPVRPHPDGFMSTCLFCGGSKLLINKFTGTTFCYSCKQEKPFEYLFEILKGCDIYSIVQEIKKEEVTKRPTYNEIIKARR